MLNTFLMANNVPIGGTGTSEIQIYPIPKSTKTPKAFDVSKSSRAPLELREVVQVMPISMVIKRSAHILKLQKNGLPLPFQGLVSTGRFH